MGDAVIEFALAPVDNLAVTSAEKAVLARWGHCSTHRATAPECPRCAAGWRHAPLQDLVAVVLDTFIQSERRIK